MASKANRRRPLDVRWVTVAMLVFAGIPALFYGLQVMDRLGDSNAPPAITIETVAGPDATSGLYTIRGHVSRLRNASRYKVVLYAQSHHWFVQPFSEQPLTDIAADGSWMNTSHYGDVYAALIVQKGYDVKSELNALPATGDDVLALSRHDAINGRISR